MAQRYLLECKECGSKILIETTQAGQTIACRSCKAKITLGTLRDIKALQPDVEQVATKEAVKQGPRMSAGSRMAFVIGLILFAAGGIWGGLSYVKYSRLLPPELDFTLPERIVQVVERSSAQEMFNAWNQVDITAFDSWTESPYLAQKKIALENRTYAYVGFGIAALGLLAIGTAFFVKL